MADEPPTNLRSLQARLRNYSRQTDQVPQRVHRLVGVLVVGQLLTDSGIGVVKGGSNLEVRLGLASTRASSDLDVLRTRTIDEFRNELEAALDGGWEGFGGRVVDRGGIPAPVPDGYRPHRFDVKLEYGGQPFQTVTLEVGVEEVGGLDTVDTVISDDGLAIFDAIGLPRPPPVHALPLHQQIAQKLHACTAPDAEGWRNDRAHDLVDLQLAQRVYGGTLTAIRGASERLFASRRRHPWPPEVTVRDGWTRRYTAEAEGLDVLPDVLAAVDWANRYIAAIARA
jgi:hypothetical protein